MSYDSNVLENSTIDEGMECSVGNEIAIIGIACSFPKAENYEEFWDNLKNEVETIEFFSDEQLLAKGVSEKLLKDPNYVKAASVLDNREKFDASFFGINPNEARSMDPQQRIFLQNCWEAIEDAGYNIDDMDKNVGVFAGCAMSTYLQENLMKNKDFLKIVNQEQVMIGNDRDYLTTRVSYKLNLKGPSISVSSACSSSLVAIHLAKESILLGECDMALAGGVSLMFTTDKGYMYSKGGIMSKDGHCRAFDENATGTIWGDGSAVILLKRLDKACEDGDHIYAIIKGSAINNDGSSKVGFTAPSVEGQVRVIEDALYDAGLTPDDIDYIETHGTGTSLGDSIEIDALNKVFSKSKKQKHSMPIGSVKPNIGHLNTASGMASLIKSISILKDRVIPPTLHFNKINDEIDFEDSKLYVNNKNNAIVSEKAAINIAISSLGIGGTNCYMILQENPEVHITNQQKKDYYIFLSARSEEELLEQQDNLAEYLETHTNISLFDVVNTLKYGRKSFSCRAIFKVSNIEEAIQALKYKEEKFCIRQQDGNEVDEKLIDWLKGKKVVWDEKIEFQKVPLPTYPFNRKEFFVEPSKKSKGSGSNLSTNQANSAVKGDYYEKMENMSDWFYSLTWKQTFLPVKREEKTDNFYRFIFVDSYGLGFELAKKFEKLNEQVVLIVRGDFYQQETDNFFVINPKQEQDYCKVLRQCLEDDIIPDAFLFAWSLDSDGSHEIVQFDNIIESQYNNLFSVLFIVHAIAECELQNEIQMAVLTNHLFDVVGTEELCIDASTIIGLLTVVQQEHKNIFGKLIDLYISIEDSDEVQACAEYIINELAIQDNNLVCAYRGKNRYVRSYERFHNEKKKQDSTILKRDGVYVLFGGLEGIALTIAKNAAENIGSKILILEEKGFPEQELWDSYENRPDCKREYVRKIDTVKKFIALNGAYIGTIDEFVDNPLKLDEIESRYGKINGIFHATGGAGIKIRKPVAHYTVENWINHAESVVETLLQLDNMFKGRKLDFRIAISGLVSILGGMGSISLSTVANVQKAFIIRHNRKSDEKWMLQCWDASEAVWLPVKEKMPEDMFGVIETVAISVEEGIESFERTLNNRNFSELEISATNFINRYERWVKFNGLQNSSGGNIEVSRIQNTDDILLQLIINLLGDEDVKLSDNFFEVGGHSLLGVQLLSLIKTNLHVEIDLPIIYKYQVISELAEYIDTLRTEK